MGRAVRQNGGAGSEQAGRASRARQATARQDTAPHGRAGNVRTWQGLVGHGRAGYGAGLDRMRQNKSEAGCKAEQYEPMVEGRADCVA